MLRVWLNQKKNSAKSRGWKIKKGKKQTGGLVRMVRNDPTVCYSAEEAFRKEGGGLRGEDLNVMITNSCP